MSLYGDSYSCANGCGVRTPQPLARPIGTSGVGDVAAAVVAGHELAGYLVVVVALDVPHGLLLRHDPFGHHGAHGDPGEARTVLFRPFVAVRVQQVVAVGSQDVVEDERSGGLVCRHVGPH